MLERANLYRRSRDRNYYDRLGAPLGLGLPAGAPLPRRLRHDVRRLPLRTRAPPALRHRLPTTRFFSARRRAPGEIGVTPPLGVYDPLNLLATPVTYPRRRAR